MAVALIIAEGWPLKRRPPRVNESGFRAGLRALTLVHRLPLEVVRADVDRFGADDLGLLELLQHMGSPAGGAADGEHGGEQLRGNRDRVQDDRRVELHVGVEIAAGLY